MFEASEALQKTEATKKLKTKSFHQYSWNSEVETTWISLIGRPHLLGSIRLKPGFDLGLIPKLKTDLWITLLLQRIFRSGFDAHHNWSKLWFFLNVNAASEFFLLHISDALGWSSQQGMSQKRKRTWMTHQKYVLKSRYWVWKIEVTLFW